MISKDPIGSVKKPLSDEATGLPHFIINFGGGIPLKPTIQQSKPQRRLHATMLRRDRLVSMKGKNAHTLLAEGDGLMIFPQPNETIKWKFTQVAQVVQYSMSIINNLMWIEV